MPTTTRMPKGQRWCKFFTVVGIAVEAVEIEWLIESEFTFQHRYMCLGEACSVGLENSKLLGTEVWVFLLYASPAQVKVAVNLCAHVT